MKNSRVFTLWFFLAVLLVFPMGLVGCGGSSDGSSSPAADVHDELLFGTWLWSTSQGFDISFANITITFTDAGYTFDDPLDACMKEGTWTAADGTLTTRPTSGDCPPNDGVYQLTAKYTVDATTLTLKFDDGGVEVTLVYTKVI